MVFGTIKMPLYGGHTKQPAAMNFQNVQNVFLSIDILLVFMNDKKVVNPGYNNALCLKHDRSVFSRYIRVPVRRVKITGPAQGYILHSSCDVLPSEKCNLKDIVCILLISIEIRVVLVYVLHSQQHFYAFL